MSSLLWRPVHGLAKKWARHRITKAAKRPQDKTLVELLTKAQNTAFGEEFKFNDILAADDVYTAFSQAVPIMDYAAWTDWLGERGPLAKDGPNPLTNVAWPSTIDIFCLSSGTTSGRTKYVPYSNEMAAINRDTALDFFAHVVAERPALVPMHHRTLYMSGSTNVERNQNGVICGDMSGLTKYLAPKLLEKYTLPPPGISSLDSWQDRLTALVDLCQAFPNIGAISGIPIWQLTLLEAIAATGKSVQAVMPNLRYLIHGGMSIEPYRDRIAALAGPDVTFLEVYAASETGITGFQLPGEEGMRFQQGYGVFYEFEDESGQVLQASQVQPEHRYTLLVSSCAGLWRYRIGDVVVFSKTNPLTIAYVTRDKTTSAFDEKVTEKELEIAMSGAAPSFADFSLGPDTTARRHVWFVIGDKHPGKEWMANLDRRLRAGNEDYDDYRGDGRINAPIAVTIPNRANFLQAIGREEGGQRKFPRLLSPDETTKLLKTFSDTQ